MATVAWRNATSSLTDIMHWHIHRHIAVAVSRRLYPFVIILLLRAIACAYTHS